MVEVWGVFSKKIKHWDKAQFDLEYIFMDGGVKLKFFGVNLSSPILRKFYGALIWDRVKTHYFFRTILAFVILRVGLSESNKTYLKV